MPKKFGVYIPEDLSKEIEDCMKVLGLKSKSKLVQEALRSFILEHRWRIKGRVAGIIGVVYNHEVKGVDEELTDIQHNFLDIINSALHIHLDRERCMLVIVVRGSSEKIKDLLNRIVGTRGVLIARPMLLAPEEK